MPIQHLLIPVSTGNGTQQLVSIPLSLAAGFGNQMQLLATSSGQLIATNMAGLAPQLNLTIPTSSKDAVMRRFLSLFLIYLDIIIFNFLLFGLLSVSCFDFIHS